MRQSLVLLCAGMGFCSGTVSAHYNMLLPHSASAKKGESVTITYQWGHPYEHELFDAPKPTNLFVVTPEGKRIELTDKLVKKMRKVGTKETTTYQISFSPNQRGDFIFLLITPPIWMEEDGEFVQDTVKTVMHVQVQKGWDVADGEFTFAPLTRPYGLRPGMVFQALFPPRASGKSTSLSLVEIEPYHSAPPEKLPSDEHVTRTVKLDPNGVATTTLTEPGWWSLTISRPHGSLPHAGKDYPLRQRSTLWVFVDEAATR